jgi:hypothetical protein
VAQRVAVAGVVAALSLVSDQTRGHPPGEAMRACLVAIELARRLGLESVTESDVYYSTLMRFAGCAATWHEAAIAFGGDDGVLGLVRRPERRTSAPSRLTDVCRERRSHGRPRVRLPGLTG